jgi:transposase
MSDDDKHIKVLKRIRKLEQEFNRRKTGSNNQAKTAFRLAKKQRKAENQRLDQELKARAEKRKT